MSGPITKLQQDHLSELTRGQVFPLPALDISHIELILELLQQAYVEIKAAYPTTIATANENDINSLMVERLNHLVGTDPLASQLVRAVSRGTETKNYDASLIEKRPDIQISLTSRLHLFPLIVECKLIDKQNGKTVSLYCKNGLSRFVIGDYAWTNSEAMMLAYVRDGASTATLLHPYLVQASTPYRVVSPPQKFGSLPDAAESTHGRSFTYVHGSQNGKQPGDIKVWHLWVQ